jgi:hypothetical protein
MTVMAGLVQAMHGFLSTGVELSSGARSREPVALPTYTYGFLKIAETFRFECYVLDRRPATARVQSTYSITSKHICDRPALVPGLSF